MARTKRLFSTETSQDKKMIRSMIDQCDPEFIRWAFHAALSWRNKELPANFFHIHGKADLVLPLRFTKPGYLIEKGDHLMVMTKAGKINAILGEIFN
jgi:hypothetical protein